MPLELSDLKTMVSVRRSHLKSDNEIRAELRAYADEVMLDAVLSDHYIPWWPDTDPAEGGAAVYTSQGREQWYLGGDHGPRWKSLKDTWSSGRLKTEVDAITSIDKSSTDIVSLLSDPRGNASNGGIFSDRGLVIGYVQSGKTTSFTAVAAKAADAGYKIVIVLSGLADNLRRQTQARLDSDLKPAMKWISLTSVGEIEVLQNGQKRLRVGDFPKLSPVNISLFGPGGDLTAYVVVKKNVSRLRSLLKWLNTGAALLGDMPILVIDDEADQGSVDTSKAKDEAKRTAINKAILDILKLPRAAYLGYTATPFANLLIDPRFQESEEAWDLFPRDFIYALPEPGVSYFGTKAIFGFTPPDIADDEMVLDGAPVINEIPEDEAKNLAKKIKQGAAVSESLDVADSALGEAIRYFYLATAARIKRGQSHRHSTMLAHTSQYVLNHGNLQSLVQGYVDEIYEQLQSDPKPLLEIFEQQWLKEAGLFNPEQNAIEAFAEIKASLQRIIDEQMVKVVIENAASDDRLDYHKEADGELGQYQIVVGGNVLARGLTLEGLVSTYFCRTSNTYDALLQMGRWFGYRAGYADLPRIWMTGSTRESFEHLAQVEEELRLNIRRLQVDPNMTPHEAGLKIRSHPKIAVTAPNRMQYATRVDSDFSQSTHQTTHFEIKDLAEIRQNWQAGSALVDGLLDGQYEENIQPGKRLFFGVEQSLITKFLSTYRLHETWAHSAGDLLNFINIESNHPHELHWNVGIISGVAARDEEQLGRLAVRPLGRSRLMRMGLNEIGEETIADINALKNSSTDEAIDLSILGAMNGLPHKEWRGIRSQRREALLALYPVARDGAVDRSREPNLRKPRADMDAAGTLLGFMLVFPGAQGRHSGSYYELNRALVAEATSQGDLGALEIDVEDENA